MSFKTTLLILMGLYCSFWTPTSFGRPLSGETNAKDQQKAVDYLTNYGYLRPPDARSGQPRRKEEVTSAIKMFQMYAGIPVTGVVDNKTIEMIVTPRCGMSDFGRSDATRRRKRYAVQGSSWAKKSLTYEYQSGPHRSITMEQVKELMDKAFKEWERHTNLRFTETSDSKTKADILVRFFSGSHNDGYPFDGKGGVLAHGFYPHNNEPGLAGDVHFDDDEDWVLPGTGDGTDFYWTALHEIGHSLGLDHSNYKEAVMYPFYTGFKENLTLKNDDILGIRYLYGMRNVTIQTQPPPTKLLTEVVLETVPPPTKVSTNLVFPSEYPKINACRMSFDAVFADDKSGITYFFSGKYYRTVDENGQRNGPYLINERWNKLPGDGIDAAYQIKENTTFFKGKHCWVYKGTQLLKEKQNISREFGLNSSIDSIDAAFVWGANGKIYLFKGDLYWRYNEAINSLDMGYPKRIGGSWHGVPSSVDSALTWINGKTYFFKGNDFWLFDNVMLRVTDDKPMRNDKYWMNCLFKDPGMENGGNNDTGVGDDGGDGDDGDDGDDDGDGKKGGARGTSGRPQVSLSVILVLLGLVALLQRTRDY